MVRVIVRGTLERAAKTDDKDANARITWSVGSGKAAKTYALPTKFRGDDVLDAVLSAGSPLVEADGILIRTEHGKEFLAMKILPLREDVRGRGIARV